MAQPDTSFGLARIGQIAVTVGNLERAVTFYRDTLGMPLLFQVPNMAFFDCGGIRLMLSLAEKQGEIFSSVIYYKSIRSSRRTKCCRHEESSSRLSRT